MKRHFFGFTLGTLIACLVAMPAFALGARPETSSPSITLASDTKGLPGAPPTKAILSVQGTPRASNAPAPIDVSLDKHGVCTYRFSASFTPQATAAVTVFSLQGSASKTVRVTKVFLTGHSTANAQEIVALQRTSALGAGGTTVNPTAAKMDTVGVGGATCTATAVAAHYTTTLKAAGTGVGGPITTQDFWTGVVTTPTVALPGVLLFPEGGAPLGEAIVLRGVADFLELQNVNAGNLSAGTVLQYVVEAEEE